MIARSVIAGKLRKEREVSFPIPALKDIAQPLMGRTRLGFKARHSVSAEQLKHKMALYAQREYRGRRFQLSARTHKELQANHSLQSPKTWLVRGLVKFVPAR